MAPSLNELVEAKVAAGEAGFEDADDMWGKELIFNESMPVQEGWTVKVVGVDMDAGTHRVELLSGNRRTIKNDAGVYESIE